MFFLIFARAFCHRALLTLVSTLNLKHLKLQAEVFQVCKTGRCHNSSDGVKLTKGLWLLHTAPENHPLVLRTPPAAHHRCVQPCSQSLSCISASRRHRDPKLRFSYSRDTPRLQLSAAVCWSVTALSLSTGNEFMFEGLTLHMHVSARRGC